MIASVVGIVLKIAWVFYALGPQLAICLSLGYLSARKSGGSMLNWLVAAFLVALLPLAGVVIMILAWLREVRRVARAPREPGAQTSQGDAEATP
jgi:hypothetical protein